MFRAQVQRILPSLWLLCLLLGPAFNLWASEEGTPLVRTLLRGQILDGHLAGDAEGRVYLCSDGRLRCHDGTAWSDLELPGQPEITALAVDSANVLWVGGARELGCLLPRPDGTREYKSVFELVPQEQRDYGHLWNIRVAGDAVFFCASTRVFRLRKGVIDYWDIPSGRRLFMVEGGNDSVWLHSRGKLGLLRLGVGSSNPEVLAGEEVIYRQIRGNGIISSLRDGDDRLLCPTTSGCLRMDVSGKLEMLPWPANPLLAEANIEDAVRLSDGTFAFATMKAGVLVVDRQGRLVRRLCKENGALPSNHANALLEVAPGCVWTVTNQGLVEWRLDRSVTLFDERAGLVGTSLALARFDGRLWLGSIEGVRTLAPAADDTHTATWQAIRNYMQHSRVFLPDGNSLWTINISEPWQYFPDGRAQALVRTGEGKNWDLGGSADMVFLGPDRLLIATMANLQLLERKGKFWQLLSLHKVTNVRQVLPDSSDPDGCVFRTFGNDLYRLSLSTPDAQPRLLLPSSRTHHIQQCVSEHGRIRIYADTGTWMLSPGADKFVLAEAQSSQPRIWAGGGGGGVGWILRDATPPKPDDDGQRIYLLYRAVPDEAIGWREAGAPVQQLTELGQLGLGLAEQEGVLWFSGSEMLLRVDTTLLPTGKPASTCRLRWRALQLDGQRQSLPLATQEAGELLVPPDHPLDLAWGLPNGSSPGPACFQVRLVGSSDDWSAPTPVTHWRLDHLSPGHYRFEVRCLGPLEDQPGLISLSFLVAPHWYQTWMARGALGGLLLLGILGLLKWNARRLLDRQRVLEGVVLSRTRSLRQSNELLRSATSAKTDFVRTVSHELRNPIAGARMMSELLLRAPLDAAQRSQAEKLRGCLSYLQRLLDNTLDLASLEAGQVPYLLNRADLHDLLRDTAALFETSAAEAGLAFTLELPARGTAYGILEVTHLQRVVVNFLGNALKFTRQGGVTLRAVPAPPIRGLVPAWRIEVLDTGSGVPDAVRPLLFQPFIRDTTAGALGDSQQGAGLGLALCRRLAELSGARILHEPRAGGGSLFAVEWPLLPASADPELPDPRERDFSALRVLVVLDDPLQLEELGRFLEQLGVSATPARDIDTGESLLCGQPFDLAIVGHSLGAHIGIDLLERCRARGHGGRTAPRVFLLGSRQAATLDEDAFASGCAGTLVSPLSLTDLYSLLVSTLSS